MSFGHRRSARPGVDGLRQEQEPEAFPRVPCLSFARFPAGTRRLAGEGGLDSIPGHAAIL